MMKKLNLFLWVLTMITIFSCGSDDSTQETEELTKEELLIGKWQITAINDLPENDCELLGTLEINADGSFEEQNYGGFPGVCSPDDLRAGTWELSENTLTLTLNELGNSTSLTFTNTILELTKTTLKYTFEDDNGDGTILTEIWTYGK